MSKAKQGSKKAMREEIQKQGATTEPSFFECVIAEVRSIVAARELASRKAAICTEFFEDMETTNITIH